MSSEEDVLKDYSESLSDLKLNSKPLINMLTMLAEENMDQYATSITKLIERRLFEVESEYKLHILYLIDSIVKNVKIEVNGLTYCDLFGKRIVDVFCHVFDKANEKTRSSLYKLRQTWKSYFPSNKLYEIDVRIKAIDPAWPITAKPVESGRKSALIESSTSAPIPANVQKQVYINPKFLDDPAKVGAQTTLNSSTDISTQLLNKQKELLQIQKEKFELERFTQNISLDDRRKPQPANPRVSKNLDRSANKIDRESFTKPVSHRQQDVNTTIERNLKKRLRNIASSNHSRKMPRRLIGDKDNDKHEPPLVKPKISTPVHSSFDSSNHLHYSSTPTSTVAIPSLPTPIIPPETESESLPWAKDIDYRQELPRLDVIPSKPEKPNDLGICSEYVPPEASHTIEMGSMAGPTFVDDSQLCTMVDGELRNLYYLDDKTAIVLMKGLINVPFNELVSINPLDLEPKQISFEGSPTKVFIDRDRGCEDFILLDFTRMLSFYHNGHEQFISFGGPCREIILNGKPYMAKFGGPPIKVWFNGETHPHTIQLDSNLPKVRLSDTCRYDLWNEYVSKRTGVTPATPRLIETSYHPSVGTMVAPPVSKSHEVAPNLGILTKRAPESGYLPDTPASSIPSVAAPTNDSSSTTKVNVQDLLNKLLASGLINIGEGNTENSTSSNSTTVSNEKSKKIVPAEQNESPLELNPGSLKIQRPSVIAALFNGIQCTNCSLRFDDSKDDTGVEDARSKYSKHLDWHFRQNRKGRTKNSGNALKRSWFYSLDLWLLFKEVTDEEDVDRKLLFQENQDDEQSGDPPILPSVLANQDDKLNVCSVCGETFEVVWREEEEEWKLINAVEDGDKIFHPLCLEDYLRQIDEENEPTQRKIENEPVLRGKEESGLCSIM